MTTAKRRAGFKGEVGDQAIQSRKSRDVTSGSLWWLDVQARKNYA